MKKTTLARPAPTLPASTLPALVPVVLVLMALILVGLSLARPAPAQDSRPAATIARRTTQLTTPALVVRTTHDEVVMAMLNKVSSPQLLPELEKGRHYLLELFGPGKLRISTGDGDVGFLKAMLMPGPLAEVFAEEIAEELSAVEANVTLTLGQLGVPTKEAARMIRAVAGFPHQVARMDLQVSGDPMKTTKGVRIDLRLTPAANTWFSKVVGGLEANDQGAPVLDAEDAPVHLGVAVKPGGIVPLLEPVLGLMACLGTRNKNERETGKEMLQKLLDGQDGSMAAAGDPFAGSFRKITGLRNAAGVKEVMASEAFAKLTENQASIVPTVDAEFERRAFVHREVAVSRLTMDLAASGLNQVTTQYAAVAGSYLLSLRGENEAVAKAMIDAVLDQKVKRAPLAESALLTLTLDLEKMFDQLAGLGIPAPVGPGDGPGVAKARLFRGEGSLQFKISIE